jgi:hypothetical protein
MIATTTPSTISVKENKMLIKAHRVQYHCRFKPGRPPRFVQKKILAADVAHFKTIPGYEDSPEEKNKKNDTVRFYTRWGSPSKSSQPGHPNH